MSNNYIIKYEKSFIAKIKNFFRRLFGKHKVQSDTKIKEEKQYSFFYDIKVDAKATNSIIEKKSFLEEIDGNEEALKMLSIDRLKKLEKYYDGVIEQNNKIIEKLKNEE